MTFILICYNICQIKLQNLKISCESFCGETFKSESFLCNPIEGANLRFESEPIDKKVYSARFILS